MIFGITTDRRLRVREDVPHWKPVPISGSVNSVTVLPNGTLLAANNDGTYTRSTLTSGWRPTPDSPAGVKVVAGLPNGDILGVSSSGYFLRKSGPDSYWKPADDRQLRLIDLAPLGSDMVFGVGEDRTLYRRTLNTGRTTPWEKVPNSSPVIAATVLPDGTLLGINDRNRLQVWLPLAGRWKDISTSEDISLIGLAVLPDGGILGIGMDTQLYTRAPISWTGWRPMNLAAELATMTVMPDGTFVGLTPDGYLQKNTGHTANSWEKVNSHPYPLQAITVSTWGNLMAAGRDLWMYEWLAGLDAKPTMWKNSYGVTGLAMLPDRHLVGIATTRVIGGQDAQLCEWIRAEHAGQEHVDLWNTVTKSRDPIGVRSITALPNGRLVGVGLDNQLYTREKITDTWVFEPDSGMVTSVSALADGSLIGVGLDRQAYVWPNFQDLGTSPWRTSRLQAGVQLDAVAAGPGGTLLGVTLNKTLCTIDRTSGDCAEIPGSGPVIGVATLTDGTIVGVGDDNRLKARSSLQAPWSPVPSSGGVKAVAAMPDGTLLGVRTDDTLCTKAGLSDYWEPVPGSGNVRSVSVLPDGTILAVGSSDHELLTRTALRGGAWRISPDILTAKPADKLLSVAVLPDDFPQPPGTWPFAVSRRPADWLLEFTSPDAAASDGDGRPWGDGTAMSRRAYAKTAPWDHGCLVTPMIGGHAALAAIREALEAAIIDATDQGRRGVPAGERGHVYLADWLLNGLRDLSETRQGQKWDPATKPVKDQTALGLILRMMSAGITVRIMLWLPTTAQAQKFGAHANEHWNLAAAVQDHNETLQRLWSLQQPLGVVALDARTAYTTRRFPSSVASHHQKMIAVRVGTVNVGFCGGVDLAFTRRDYGGYGRSGSGDWQSGLGSPPSAGGWPRQDPPPTGGYPPYPYKPADTYNQQPFPEDLPENAYGKGNRHWHDQHLKLEGPVVASLEDQFAERWVIDTGTRAFLFNRDSTIGIVNQVNLTSAQAIQGVSGQADNAVVPLPSSRPVPPAGEAIVQMWRTIPMYPGRTVEPFARGEFTVLAGVAKAITQARHLITIWDQYFWSSPLAKLVANQLNTHPTLRLLIVLPPYGTTTPETELGLRMDALQVLWEALGPDGRARVLVRNMWDTKASVGIYVHDKVQTYDDALLVCGSANMNRRSFECDSELDCAVLHTPTVRSHLARLQTSLAGEQWTDFGPGWLHRYWTSFTFGISGSSWYEQWLIDDPFFKAKNAIGSPTLPGGTVNIPTAGGNDFMKSEVYNPTCFATDLATASTGLNPNKSAALTESPTCSRGTTPATPGPHAAPAAIRRAARTTPARREVPSGEHAGPAAGQWPLCRLGYACERTARGGQTRRPRRRSHARTSASASVTSSRGRRALDRWRRLGRRRRSRGRWFPARSCRVRRRRRWRRRHGPGRCGRCAVP
ncbi:hypothetical protein ACRYCC_31350 [Actinomadura scrupuli]|uniref:hypothetical protein n=1 Tax=Actinomadura scrupuli TaxID=559629 RepID=UPI003D96EDB1